MTIVIQHQFWDLAPGETFFSVTLRFGGQPKRLSMPYQAVTRFYDPSVQFLLQFEPPEGEVAPPPRANWCRCAGRRRWRHPPSLRGGPDTPSGTAPEEPDGPKPRWRGPQDRLARQVPEEVSRRSALVCEGSDGLLTLQPCRTWVERRRHVDLAHAGSRPPRPQATVSTSGRPGRWPPSLAEGRPSPGRTCRPSSPAHAPPPAAPAVRLSAGAPARPTGSRRTLRRAWWRPHGAAGGPAPAASSASSGRGERKRPWTRPSWNMA